jgi:hypothetical protein
VQYSHPKDGTTSVQCLYDNFKALGSKNFPTSIALSLSTNATKQARKMQIKMKLNSLDTSDDWDPRTTVSKKYKEVSVDDVLKKIMSL